MDKKELTAMIAMEYIRGIGLFSHGMGEYINNASDEELENITKNITTTLNNCSKIADMILTPET